MANYYDDWRNTSYDCPACKWHGLGKMLPIGEVRPDSFDLLCPACGENVTFVMNPTLEESRANFDKLSDAERQQVETIERIRAKFAERQLTEATPLPDIDSPSFVLHWDQDHAGLASDTLIKHGDTIIFREPVIYEGYERFIKVAEILRARYGPALTDLVPTSGSEIYLYGDRLYSPRSVAEARERIFTNATGND